MGRRASAFLVVLLSLYARASEVPLATVTLGSSAVTYVASTGAALVLQCPGLVVRYAPGSAGVPPTATSASLRLDFTTRPEGWPIQLAATEDRISILGTSGAKCYVFTQTAPTPTVITNVAGQQCSVYKQTTISVGTTPTQVPASQQFGRLGVEICISGLNAGSPKVICAVDPAVNHPALAGWLTEVGDDLQFGGVPCRFYALSTAHQIWCVADTGSTALKTTECVPP